MSDTLPTREEIADIARATLIRHWSHPEMMADGVVQEIDEDSAAIADALLARLRPAWEQMEENYLESIRNLTVVGQDMTKERDTLRAELSDVERRHFAVQADLEKMVSARIDLDEYQRVVKAMGGWQQAAEDLRCQLSEARQDLRACAEALEVV